MIWWVYALLFVIGLLITGSAVYAFFWAQKNGEFRDLEGQSRSIFDETEPEGMQTDFFPKKKPHKLWRPHRNNTATNGARSPIEHE